MTTEIGRVKCWISTERLRLKEILDRETGMVFKVKITTTITTITYFHALQIVGCRHQAHGRHRRMGWGRLGFSTLFAATRGGSAEHLTVPGDCTGSSRKWVSSASYSAFCSTEYTSGTVGVQAMLEVGSMPWGRSMLPVIVCQFDRPVW